MDHRREPRYGDPERAEDHERQGRCSEQRRQGRRVARRTQHHQRGPGWAWALSCISRAHGSLPTARRRNRMYAPRVKRLRAVLERLTGGHRPPTGPMTTEEATDAEKIR